MLINSILRERKYHFVIRIHKEERTRYDIQLRDILILNISKTEIIRPVRRDFYVSLPKMLLKGKEHGKSHGNALYIYGRENFNKINGIDGFRLHETRKDKFLVGFA